MDRSCARPPNAWLLGRHSLVRVELCTVLSKFLRIAEAIEKFLMAPSSVHFGRITFLTIQPLKFFLKLGSTLLNTVNVWSFYVVL